MGGRRAGRSEQKADDVRCIPLGEVTSDRKLEPVEDRLGVARACRSVPGAEDASSPSPPALLECYWSILFARLPGRPAFAEAVCTRLSRVEEDALETTGHSDESGVDSADRGRAQWKSEWMDERGPEAQTPGETTALGYFSDAVT